MFNNKSGKIIAFLLALIVIITAIVMFTITLASTSNTSNVNSDASSTISSDRGDIIIEGVTGEENSSGKDSNKHITVTRNDTNGNHYEFLLTDPKDIQQGDQIETTDYVYTYGYSFTNSSAVAVYGSLTNWTANDEDSGDVWGVRVKDTSKVTYESVYTLLYDKDVASLQNTFANCTKMLKLPVISDRATNIENICYGCTSLTEVSLPNNVVSINKNAFYGCLSLRIVYIPKTISTIDDTPFRNCNTSAIICIENNKENSIDMWPANWNATNSTGTAKLQYYTSFALQEYQILINDGYIWKDNTKITITG